jgi:hypothetical protein
MSLVKESATVLAAIDFSIWYTLMKNGVPASNERADTRASAKMSTGLIALCMLGAKRCVAPSVTKAVIEEAMISIAMVERRRGVDESPAVF